MKQKAKLLPCLSACMTRTMTQRVAHSRRAKDKPSIYSVLLRISSEASLAWLLLQIIGALWIPNTGKCRFEFDLRFGLMKTL